MMEEIDLRLQKISHLSRKMDGILIPNFHDVTDTNFLYFTNFSGYGIFYYDFREARLFSFSLDYGRARQGWVKNVQQIKTSKDIFSILRKKKIGIAKAYTDAATFERLGEKLNLVDVSKDLELARALKTDYEIKCIKKACGLTGRVFKHAFGRIDSCDTEADLRKVVDKKIIDLGLENAFPTIAASGENIQYPHHEPGSTKLKGPVLVDAGVKYNGYCSDVTRTTGSKYEKIILKAIETAADRVKPGAKVKDIDKAARRAMGKYSKNFITSLGHGFGLQVHEYPNVSSFSKAVLKEGMVITIEPGIYLPNGIRIENDYIVTEDGCINLTDF